MKGTKEFKIESMPDTQFRVCPIPAVEMLALGGQLDFENFKSSVTLYTYALEHIEVKIAEQWQKVKTPDKEIYFPLGIENDMSKLSELVTYFAMEVVGKAFMKSSE